VSQLVPSLTRISDKRGVKVDWPDRAEKRAITVSKVPALATRRSSFAVVFTGGKLRQAGKGVATLAAEMLHDKVS